MRTLTCLLGVFAALPLAAQFDTAVVLGTVRDASGSIVSASTVKLESLDTGVTATTSTDEEGNYQFFNVRFGNYRVSAEKQGFKKALSGLVKITVAARQRVDLTLEVGSVSESITISDAATPLETETSSRSTVVGNKQIVDLPLNGRSYADLTLLVPGVSPAIKGIREGRNASYHVNGLRSSYNNFTLDGIDNNAYGTSNQGFSNQVVQLAPDAVGEFRVTTNNFSAEYGRAGGAVINASLRSGSNDLHFTLWEFLRNTSLNAQGFFKPQTGKPVLIQNQFGAAAGGRIVRNKTFFFADYEGFRRTEKSLLFADLPTAAMRSGQLNVALVDPFSGQPFSGNVVPASRITPFARKVLADLPLPNRPGSGALGIGTNFESIPSATTVDDKGDVKIDHYFSSRVTSFFRYSQRESNAFSPPNIPGPSGGNSNGNTFALNKSLAGAVTYSHSPTSLVEFRFGVTFTDAGKSPVNAELPHVEEAYGIRGIPKDPRIGGGLLTQNITGFTSLGRQSSNPQFQNPDVVNPRFNYTRIAGRHSLKAGYEYQAINTEINDLAPVYGLHAYSGSFSRPSTAAANNIYNFADFLVGAPSTVELSTFVVLDYRQRMHFFYLQDDFKLSPKLTLNLGVRYEFATPQYEAQNRLGNYDPAGNRLLYAKDGSLYDRALVDPDRNNWAPRVGLAYQLTPKTVIRSGYGVSYIHFNRMGGENILGFTGPFVFRVTRNQIAPGVARGGLPVCSPGQDFLTCFLRTEDGFPAQFSDKSNYRTSTTRVNYIPRDTRTGYVQAWHLTVQRQLASDLVLDIAYVGNRGAKQLILSDFNQARPNNLGETLSLDARRPIPGFAEIQIAMGAGNTFYHSLQAKLEKRFSAGFYLLNSFTWSKAIDNAAGHLEAFNGDASRVNFYDLRSERGVSSYDLPLNNVTSIIFDVPYGRGRRWGASLHPLVNAVLGGWRATLINSMHSGYPVNLTYTPTSAFQVGNATHRPNVLPGFQNPAKDVNNYFFADKVLIPTDVRFPFGNAGRNIGRSHAFYQADVGLYKEFPLPREGARVEFRGEFFNLLNESNFVAANSNRSASNFGRVTATFPARQIQFALKLYY